MELETGGTGWGGYEFFLRVGDCVWEVWKVWKGRKIKKNAEKNDFFAQTFGQSKKMLYLCTLFPV